jgi:lysozyme family protein
VKSSYPQSIAFVLRQEGGYTNHPSDPGGPTNWGITIFDARKYWKPHATAEDVKVMPLQVAQDIYRDKYWAVVHGDDIAAGLDICTFDSAVNSGTGRAWKWLGSAIGNPSSAYATLAAASQQTKDVPAAVKKFCQTRLSFLHALKTWSVFGKGWGRRVAELQALGVRIALEATGKTKEEVKKDLSKEVTQTTKKNTGDLAKTTTAGSTTGVGTWSLWEWDFTHVAILIVTVGIVLWLGRKVVQNHQAITAYENEIKALDAVKVQE